MFNSRMTVLPAIQQGQQACRALSIQTNPLATLTPAPMNANPGHDLLPLAETTQLKIWERQVEVSPSLRWLGIYQRKTVRYARNKRDRRPKSKDTECDIISQSYQILLAWRLLKLGIQWSRQHAYGGISASLNVYPVVHDLLELQGNTFQTYSIYDVQQLFSSGALHPFTRDTLGFSLLDVSY